MRAFPLEWFRPRGRARTAALGGGLGVAGGALAMYLFDPVAGRSRRARLRDRLGATARDAVARLGRDLRDARYRVGGRLAARRSARAEAGVADDVLVERVRARAGHVVSHPGSLCVDARGGRVTLAGPVLDAEAGALLGAVARVRGVRVIVDRLERHHRAASVPGLQGEVRARLRNVAWLAADWPPSTRLAVGVGGGLAATWGIARRDGVGGLGVIAGLLALARLVAQPSRRAQRTRRTRLPSRTREPRDVRSGNGFAPPIS